MAVVAISHSVSSCTKCICAPVQWICDKIRAVAEAFFGYIIRIIVFQLGEINVRGAYTIMRIYQRLSSDPREERPFDPVRLERSKQLLIGWGGVEGWAHPADGGARIHYLTFKSAHFFEHFRQLGSEPVPVTYRGHPRTVLVPPPPATEKLRFPKVKMPDGQIAVLLPESPPGNEPRPMIFLCHSPGRSACMDQDLIQQHLGAGYDITIFDYRGTAESTGKASEGGYYLDADAVFQKVLEQGYTPDRIFLSGFCEGAAVATYLKLKYHDQGVHLIAGNPFTSMRDVVRGYGFLGRIAARYGLKAIQSNDPNIKRLVRQDGFDNVAKLRQLKYSEKASCIFVGTDPDFTMPRGSVEKLAEACAHAGHVHEIFHTRPNEKDNGHVHLPYKRVWRRLVKKII